MLNRLLRCVQDSASAARSSAKNSITLNAGTGLSGGGSVALGGTITLNNVGVISLTGGVSVSVSGATVTLSSTATRWLHFAFCHARLSFRAFQIAAQRAWAYARNGTEGKALPHGHSVAITVETWLRCQRLIFVRRNENLKASIDISCCPLGKKRQLTAHISQPSNVISSINQAEMLGAKYGIPATDVVFLALNASGVNSEFPYKRLRFLLEAQIANEYFYFGLPVRPGDSPFFYNHADVGREGNLYLGGEVIGAVHEAYDDTCDSTYPRRQGTVLNLNSGVKSACQGCAFCTTSGQTPKDRGYHMGEEQLRNLFDEFCTTTKKTDLSHLLQVAVVTGCLGAEDRVVEHLLTVRRVLKGYHYHGELFYFGSEIRSETAFDTLKENASPMAICLSVECFTRRDKLLRQTKSRITLEEAGRIMEMSRQRGFQTNFSYIVGIDSINDMKSFMPRLIEHINRFPIINVFQPHNRPDQTPLRHPNAGRIEYYLDSRKYIESLFERRTERPRPWENYRSLWYTSFVDSILTGIRTP